MPDQQHAPASAEPASRHATASPEPEVAAPEAQGEVLAQRALVAAAATGAAAGAASSPSPRPTPHGLPPGAIGAAALLGIQRSAGNRAVAGLVAGSQLTTRVPPPRAAEVDPATSAGATQRLALQRQAGQQITPNFVVPIEPDFLKMDLGKASYVRGSLSIKGEVKGELVPKGKDSAAVGAGGTSNVGGQAEITIAEQKAFSLFDSIQVEKMKETLAFELSKKKLDVSLGAEATIKTRYEKIKGVASLKFVLAGIEWEEMAKDPGSAVALGIEISGGITGEQRVNVNNDFDVILSPKVTITGEAHPNWPRIAGEVGKRVATEGGKAAVEATTTAAGTSVVTIDLGAVAASAAAIVVPLAAAVAMGYGAWQGMQNARAAREAAGWGVYGRKKAEDCAKGFARTLTGSAPGTDEGSAEAEAQIQATMRSTGATREMVIAAATQEQGGYAAIYAKNLKRIKEAIYADLVSKWFAANQANFGWLESLGDDWGQKGVFKSTLRIVMFD